MRIGRRHLLMTSVLLLAGITAYTMLGKREGFKEMAGEPRKGAMVTEKPDFRIEGINYVEIKEGRKEWELKAAVANYFKERGVAVFEDVTLNLYSREGRDFVIKGERGLYDISKRDIELKGAVRVRTNDGYSMDTDAIIYSEKERKIASAGKISFSGRDVKGEGGKMILDLEEEKLFLENGVKAVIHPEGEKR